MLISLENVHWLESQPRVNVESFSWLLQEQETPLLALGISDNWDSLAFL